MDKVVIYNVGLYCRLSLDDGDVNWLQAGVEGLFAVASTTLAYTGIGLIGSIAAGVSAGGQYLTTGSINIGQLLTDMSVGAVSGAFGGTALGHGGMFLSGFGTGFAGSIAGDLVKTDSIADVRLGAAIWSGFFGGALSGITTGAQNKQFASLSKFNNRIKVCKSKGLTNSYFTKAVKKSSALVRSANMAVIKSIPQTIGSTIIDFYW